MVQWLISLPIWLQTIVIAGTFSLFGAIIIFFFKGGKAQYKNGILNIGKNSGNISQDIETIFELIMEYVEEIVLLTINKKMDRQMKYAENKLTLIRAKKEEAFFELLSESGIQQNQLTSHEDCLFFREVCGNMIYSDNGNKSTKRIIKDFISDGNYVNKKGAEYEEFIKETVFLIKRNWDQYLNDHYKSEIFGRDGKIRERAVSREEIYNADKKILSAIEELIKDIFDNAKNIEIETATQKEELVKKRKEKVRELININNPKKEGKK